MYRVRYKLYSVQFKMYRVKCAVECRVLYLQVSRDPGRGQAMVRASIRVRGTETASSRSDRARVKMKMFLGRKWDTIDW